LDHRFPWPGNLRQLHWFVREQVKLRLGSRHDGELDIPRSVLEAWLPASTPETPTTLKDDDDPLFAWTRDGVRRLREEQLLAVLRDEVMRENLPLGSLDVSWVTERCKRLLGAKNPSQKLLDNIGKDTHEFLHALQISLPRD
jgi:hypothetical protein